MNISWLRNVIQGRERTGFWSLLCHQLLGWPQASHPEGLDLSFSSAVGKYELPRCLLARLRWRSSQGRHGKILDKSFIALVEMTVSISKIWLQKRWIASRGWFWIRACSDTAMAKIRRDLMRDLAHGSHSLGFHGPEKFTQPVANTEWAAFDLVSCAH